MSLNVTLYGIEDQVSNLYITQKLKHLKKIRYSYDIQEVSLSENTVSNISRFME